MMKSAKYLFFLLIAFLSFSVNLSSEEKLQNSSIKTAVIFNTLCAKCHEGECSGRLSFDTGSRAAHTHIKRYSEDGNISEDEIKEFYSLLNHMKKECILPMPIGGKFEPKNLSRYAIASHKAYFLALGILKKGRYRLTISTKEKQHFRIEVLSDHFDSFAETSACPEEKKKIQFTIDAPTKVFLRIRSKEPLHILALEINSF